MPQGRDQPSDLLQLEEEVRRSDVVRDEETAKLRELEDENRRLKKIAADLMLDKEMLQDVVKRKLLGRIVSAISSTVFGKIGACLPARV